MTVDWVVVLLLVATFVNLVLGIVLLFEDGWTTDVDVRFLWAGGTGLFALYLIEHPSPSRNPNEKDRLR